MDAEEVTWRNMVRTIFFIRGSRKPGLFAYFTRALIMYNIKK